MSIKRWKLCSNITNPLLKVPQTLITALCGTAEVWKQIFREELWEQAQSDSPEEVRLPQVHAPRCNQQPWWKCVLSRYTLRAHAHTASYRYIQPATQVTQPLSRWAGRGPLVRKYIFYICTYYVCVYAPPYPPHVHTRTIRIPPATGLRHSVWPVAASGSQSPSCWHAYIQAPKEERNLRRRQDRQRWSVHGTRPDKCNDQ